MVVKVLAVEEFQYMFSALPSLMCEWVEFCYFLVAIM